MAARFTSRRHLQYWLAEAARRPRSALFGPRRAFTGAAPSAGRAGTPSGLSPLFVPPPNGRLIRETGIIIRQRHGPGRKFRSLSGSSVAGAVIKALRRVRGLDFPLRSMESIAKKSSVCWTIGTYSKLGRQIPVGLFEAEPRYVSPCCSPLQQVYLVPLYPTPSSQRPLHPMT